MGKGGQMSPDIDLNGCASSADTQPKWPQREGPGQRVGDPGKRQPHGQHQALGVGGGTAVIYIVISKFEVCMALFTPPSLLFPSHHLLL